MRNVLIAVGIVRTILGSDSRIEQQRRSLHELGAGFLQQWLESWGTSAKGAQPKSLTHHPNARGYSRDPPPP